MERQKDRVKLNVGGRIFETTATTLASAGRNSFFGAMFDENWNLHSNATTNEYFIDRDPDYFAVILNLLRTGELYTHSKIDKKVLYREALYYGLLDHVRSAECDLFDGNRLRLAQSITGRSVGDGVGTKAIRASPNGWCCVAQGSVIRIYDWMLEEHATINLDYRRVNDVFWVDSENIVASFDRKLDIGGIGLFNVSTGKLSYNHQYTNQLKDYTAGTLCFSSDYKLSSNCRSSSNGCRIGVWDYVTGKLMNNIGVQTLGDVSKLQWYDTNCLMIATTYPLNQKYCCIGLFDIREKALVSSWNGSAWEQRNQYVVSCQLRKFVDVIIIKESNSICVVDGKGCLGFIDLRATTTTRSVEWKESCTPITAMDNWPCYPKLAFHEGQLYSSMNNIISVYSGRDWVRTSQLRQSHGGPISDFSIGGDRLFALHRDEGVIDVWETPRSPSLYLQ